MAERHLLARCQADTLSDATSADIAHAAYQMGYEGVPVASREHNPFEEGDERHIVFNQSVLEGMRDLEADAEVIRVIMDGACSMSEEQVDGAPTGTSRDGNSNVQVNED